MIRKFLKLCCRVLFVMIAFTYILLYLYGEPDIVEAGADFYYNSDSQHILGPFIDVPPTVEEFKFDSTHIIIRQNPKGRNTDRLLYDKTKYEYPLGLDSPHYWIIDKVNQQYWGPISEADFIRKLNEKKIRLRFEVSDKVSD